VFISFDLRRFADFLDVAFNEIVVVLAFAALLALKFVERGKFAHLVTLLHQYVQLANHSALRTISLFN